MSLFSAFSHYREEVLRVPQALRIVALLAVVLLTCVLAWRMTRDLAQHGNSTPVQGGRVALRVLYLLIVLQAAVAIGYGIWTGDNPFQLIFGKQPP